MRSSGRLPASRTHEYPHANNGRSTFSSLISDSQFAAIGLALVGLTAKILAPHLDDASSHAPPLTSSESAGTKHALEGDRASLTHAQTPYPTHQAAPTLEENKNVTVGAMTAPSPDGSPPKLTVRSDEANAKSSVRCMRKSRRANEIESIFKGFC